MTAPLIRTGTGGRPRWAGWAAAALTAGCLALCPHPGRAQQPPTPAQTPAQAPTRTAAPASKDSELPSTGNRRRAAKLFLNGNRLYEEANFEGALKDFRQAAELDPDYPNYTLAANVAASHAATALVQAAAKDRIRGDNEAARAALAHALELDPGNPQAAAHINQMSDQALRDQPLTLYKEQGGALGSLPILLPATGVHTFHIRDNQRLAYEQVFKAFGIETTIDDSVRAIPLRLDLDNVTFQQAARTLDLATRSFHVPIDAHRVLVARDTPDTRLMYMPEDLETIRLPGLPTSEMAEVTNLAKNIFGITDAVADASTETLTLRAPKRSVEAFNATIRELLNGHSQVLLDVRLIQVAHTGDRTTGVQPPQQFTAFNAYSEEQSILNANQSLVQQIISSGLAAKGDTLAILGVLLASGEVSSSVFSNGVALFGGGLTLSGLSPQPAKLLFNVNSSDSRQLDRIQLRLGDGEAGTLRAGSRYPFQLSSYSSLSSNLPSIPGLTSAGSSGALNSLLSSLTAVPPVPQVEYQDLGLTLKATPNVMRDGDVALTVDMKIDALAGQFVNGNPVLDNRAFSGVVTAKEGESVLLMSELSRQQSRAITGTPGIGEIPGLNDVQDKDTRKDFATLVVVITPHVVRGAQDAGHSPMRRVDKTPQ